MMVIMLIYCVAVIELEDMSWFIKSSLPTGLNIKIFFVGEIVGLCIIIAVDWCPEGANILEKVQIRDKWLYDMNVYL